MMGWIIAAVGGLLVAYGFATFPGGPGCKYCGQVYTSTFLQNAFYPLTAIVAGIAVLLVASYRLGKDRR